MRKLINGIVEFRERQLPQYAARFKELAGGQEPDSLFVTCSDSRVVPDLLVSTDPGDLFVMRNVGNLIPAATDAGLSVGDVSEAGAIEYALLVLNVSDIVVCGHSECGAMKAVLGNQRRADAPNLGKWLHHAYAAAFRWDNEGPLDPSLPDYDQLSQLNVLVQLEHLMTYPIVIDRVHAGTLHLSGFWFDIATGNMFAYERKTRRFEVIDRTEADRLLARLATRASAVSPA